jgi:hypothetical protein
MSIMFVLSFYASLLQFKGYSHASCGTESFSWVDSCGKGLLQEPYIFLFLIWHFAVWF